MLACLPLIVLGFLIFGVLFPAILLNLVFFSFSRLGVTPTAGLALLALSLFGGVVNLPISRRRILVEPARRGWFFGFLYYHPPRVRQQVLAINLGGAIVPVLFSVYLLWRTAPLYQSLAGVAIVAIVARLVARPVAGVGITMPAYVAPIISALAALLLAPADAPSVAYISGTVGTLVGADLLYLPVIRRMPAQLVSIGGAGVFDGIFLSGILAVLLTG